MDDQIRKLIEFRIEEFEKLTNEQLILAGLARIISGMTDKQTSFEMAIGDLSLNIAMVIRAGGNKEDAFKYMFPEDKKDP